MDGNNPVNGLDGCCQETSWRESPSVVGEYCYFNAAGNVQAHQCVLCEVDECGVCGGSGSAAGRCDCDGNTADCAGVCGGTAENCPDWEDNPGAYEFTATMVGAVVFFDGVQLDDEGYEFVALDSDGNVRGVGVQLSPPFGPYAGTPVFEMQMRSNDSGDELSFKYYDASADAVLDVDETLVFS